MQLYILTIFIELLNRLAARFMGKVIRCLRPLHCKPTWTFTVILTGTSLFLMTACERGPGPREDESLEQKVRKLQVHVFETSLDSSYMRLQQSKELIEIGAHVDISDSLIVENDYLLGLYYLKTGEIDSATTYFHKTTDQILDTIYAWRQVNYFHMAWDTYLSQNLFGECFSIIDRFESLLDRETAFQWITRAEYFKENTYSAMYKPKSALKHNQERLRLAHITKDTGEIESALISSVWINYDLGDKKSAFDVLDKLILKVDDLSLDFKRQVYENYGILMYYEGMFNKAVEYYQKGLVYTKQLADTNIPDAPYLLTVGYANLSDAYIETGEYELAQMYLDSAKLVGIEHAGEELQRNILLNQLNLEIRKGSNGSNLVEFLDTIYAHQNRQYVAKFEKELVALNQAYKKEKVLMADKQATEVQNLRLRFRVLSLSILALFSLIILGAGLLFYYYRKRRYEDRQMSMQQRLLRTQMNPHFTFNVLHSIQRLIESNKELANNYLVRFSRLLRLTLENSMFSYIELDKELEAIEQYLELQKLRMESTFDYEIKLENLRREDPIYIPPMLLQPIIENSIEHGISNLEYPGKIMIWLTRRDRWIYCEIEDNGIGLGSPRRSDKSSTSIKLISDFLKQTTQSGIEIYDKKRNNPMNSGVVNKLRIPYKNRNI